ncbi:GbsR/MarR family transcriptional regulator [Pararhodonellum marinum]|uniref:GbsR/MarR family transcriptional regulator n=1 Tax=Pararhodonellum marinum TaxID=2755358 RepID=UPI00188E5848|nr:ArsR family transcriptional regulator [Pararhodonellum marinum]
MSSSLSESQKDLIERIGVYHEQQGMQPLMGRILGLLLILDDAEATFEDIIEHLNVSKSAVSTALNVMQIQNKVAYRTKPGERKRYFYLNMGNWENDIEKELEEIARVGVFVQEALALRSNRKPDFNNYLKNLCQFTEFFKRQIPKLFKEFQKSKS